MSVSHLDGSDDLDPGHDDSEPSETRMRQALDRLSGDRAAERSADRPSPERPVFERAAAERPAFERVGHDRPVFDRSNDRGNERMSGSARPSAAGSGGFGASGTRRHRYVQDGEVPVVQISSLRDRRRDPPAIVAPPPEPANDAIRVALTQERTARQRAEQQLERAQATIHGLETRLGHAEITRGEAVELARTHEAVNVRLQSELAELATRVKAAQQEAADAAKRQRELEAKLEEAQSAAAPAPEPRPVTRRVSATRAAKAALPQVAEDEPEPVQWWLAPPVKSKSRRRA